MAISLSSFFYRAFPLPHRFIPPLLPVYEVTTLTPPFVHTQKTGIIFPFRIPQTNEKEGERRKRGEWGTQSPWRDGGGEREGGGFKVLSSSPPLSLHGSPMPHKVSGIMLFSLSRLFWDTRRGFSYTKCQGVCPTSTNFNKAERGVSLTDPTTVSLPFYFQQILVSPLLLFLLFLFPFCGDTWMDFSAVGPFFGGGKEKKKDRWHRICQIL